MILPAFIDETGGMKGPINEEPVFGVGLLILNDSASITDAFYKLHFNFVSDRRSKRNELIRLIRAESRQPTLAELNQLLWVTRHYEYKFTEIAQHNKQQYIDLLNLYFSLGLS